MKSSPALVFAGAFFGGSLLAAVFSFFGVAALNRAGGPPIAVVLIHLSCFLGGFIAGGGLRPVVETRRWPLLWLAAGSPALLVWICTIIALGRGVEMAPWVLRLTVIACIAAVAGAVSGYYIIPLLKKWAATPTGIFLKTFGRAFLLGVLTWIAALFVSGWIGDLISIGIGGVLPSRVSVLIIGGLPLLAGGFMSGKEVFPGLPRGIWRFPCLVLASPMLVVLLLLGLSHGPGNPFLGGPVVERILWLLFWTGAPVLGAFAGYRYELRQWRAREARTRTVRLHAKIPEGRDD